MSIHPITSEILQHIRISEVYERLTGQPVKRSAGDKWRGAALWRGGTNLTVAGDDARGTWMDFKSNEAGGVLDLVVRVRGGTRQDALRWVAALAGISLENKPQSPRERARWSQERRKLQRELPEARYWRRAMAWLTEELLSDLKTGVIQPEIFEIHQWEKNLAHFRRIDGAELVTEFRSWMADCPSLSKDLIRLAKRREVAERLALGNYIDARVQSERSA